MHGRRVCPDVRADTKGGRSSIAPEKLVRGLLLEVLYSIRSERMLMEQRDVPSANCAKRLRQCPREIVDLVHAVMQFRAPSPGLSDAPRRVTLIDREHGVGTGRRFKKLRQRCSVSFHAKDAVGNQQLSPLRLS